MLVAYSKHSIAAQVVAAVESEKSSAMPERVEPFILRLCTLLDETAYDGPVLDYHLSGLDGDETIQCLRIVELEDVGICPSRFPDHGDYNSHSGLLAVVFGTNRNRLLVSELIVKQKHKIEESSGSHWSLECLSGENGCNVLEVLPCDDHDVADFIRRKNKQGQGSLDAMAPFQPSGGVCSIRAIFDTTVNPLEKTTTYVWITYKDGNLVRMHHAALFPSVWAEGSDSDISVDQLLSKFNHTALFRCRVRLQPGIEQSVSIVPLPKYHPTPLAPVSIAGTRDGKHDTCYEALVFGSSDSAFPTLCIFSSEDHFWEPQPVKKSESLVADVTMALVGGVVGALRWATNSSSHIDESRSGGTSSVTEPGNGGKLLSLPSRPFPSIWNTPVSLLAGSEFHDVPRVVEDCAVDEDGQYAALADGLGRVLLIDLSTKQIVRMWKGLRQASCCWAKVRQGTTRNDSHQTRTQRRSKSYLVVHSKQRRVVEVWPPRSGNRLASFMVNRDSMIVQSPHPACSRLQSYGEREHNVYVLDSIVPGGPATALKVIDMDRIVVQQQQDANTRRSSSREATMHVHHLKQLLSAEKAMFATKDDVYDAFCRIKSLSDISSCLDLVATATVLEDELLVEGAAFQKLALKYCTDMLEDAKKKNGEIVPSGAAALSRKINYYSRVSDNPNCPAFL